MKTLKFFFLTILIISGCTKKEETNTKPTIEIVSPSNNSTFDVGDTIVFKIKAQDADNNIVPTIELAIDELAYKSGQLKDGECTIPVYTTNWENGPANISVRVYDARGDFSDSQLTIYLNQVYKPTVSLLEIKDVSANSVTITGAITNTGGAKILSCGFILESWPENTSITKYCDVTTISQYKFTLVVNDLQMFKYYGVKNAFASNKVGKEYSSGTVLSFFTAPEAKGVFTDARDNKEYAWVKIGNQSWMAENLAYLPKVDNYASLTNTGSEQYLVYNYTPDENLSEANQITNAKSSSNYQLYGVLYNWKVVENNNMCPSGWHIPTFDEWNLMKSYLLGYSTFTNDNMGRMLASSSGWETSSYYNEIGYKGGGDNVLGFSAVSGGDAMPSGFYSVKEGGAYWTPTIDPAQSYYPVKIKGFDYRHSGIDEGLAAKDEAHSIRCIKN